MYIYIFSESCFATLILLLLYAGKTAANIPDNDTSDMIIKKSFVRVNETPDLLNGVIELVRICKIINEIEIPNKTPRNVMTPPSKVIILKILCFE